MGARAETTAMSPEYASEHLTAAVRALATSEDQLAAATPGDDRLATPADLA
jgi:hypothetical protein